jgi:NAD(P)-dependent dehydrogenase (short-subunit alcohol dehydrogenase family)
VSAALRHSGKTALVTGAASGIGLAVAERLHAEGARVVLSDIDALRLAEAARRLGEGVIAVPADVSDEGSVDALFERAMAAFDAPDIVVNNAGMIRIEPVTATAFDDWRKVMAVNLDGVFLGSRAAARAMIAAGKSGVIINAASGAAKRGVPNIASYCASKAAIVMLSQSLALELAPHRIRVNCYAPGHIETPFWEGIAEGFAGVMGIAPGAVIERFRQSVPWGRFGKPEEVAATVSWLASDDAEYINAQTIAMNGAEFPG